MDPRSLYTEPPAIWSRIAELTTSKEAQAQVFQQAFMYAMVQGEKTGKDVGTVATSISQIVQAWGGTPAFDQRDPIAAINSDFQQMANIVAKDPSKVDILQSVAAEEGLTALNISALTNPNFDQFNGLVRKLKSRVVGAGMSTFAAPVPAPAPPVAPTPTPTPMPIPMPVPVPAAMPVADYSRWEAVCGRAVLIPLRETNRVDNPRTKQVRVSEAMRANSAAFCKILAAKPAFAQRSLEEVNDLFRRNVALMSVVSPEQHATTWGDPHCAEAIIYDRAVQSGRSITVDACLLYMVRPLVQSVSTTEVADRSGSSPHVCVLGRKCNEPRTLVDDLSRHAPVFPQEYSKQTQPPYGADDEGILEDLLKFYVGKGLHGAISNVVFLRPIA